ncbi:metallohydrolase [Luteimonas fraxinea]|uniref:metallohydrolase n=1 Tax=Luteimonas fraxinea TaxID=2901869 RepID=UPI001E58BA4B|nr:metallohydrolase [Luteimonas fraxinea]MCD9126016.1 metallohydrolase [Luteimonas fraxinea]
MQPVISFFPVGNGDMSLIRLLDGTAILIDCRIRLAADDPSDPDARDVAKDLRDRLPRDDNGRPYVDAFLLSHPDEDHCCGLRRHFHLGAAEDYADDSKPDEEKKIFIREMWSSPIIFRRKSKLHVLCEDAKAWAAEARRRVKLFREQGWASEGNRILIMGEDKDGKTDDLGAILIKSDDVFSRINGATNNYFSARLLAPSLVCDDEEEIDLRAKNRSSVILNFEIWATPVGMNRYRFLTGGDAEVDIWERLWERYEATPDVLEYDILETPHHCSWRVLSHDSWSNYGEAAQVSAGARAALSQARYGAKIVASCKPIVEGDGDPPCTRAKREFEAILDPVDGKFVCTGETPHTWAPAPIDIDIAAGGPRLREPRTATAAAATAAAAAPRAGCGD